MLHETKHRMLAPLAQIFPQEPLLVTDGPELYEYLLSSGMRAHLISEGDEQLLQKNRDNVVYLFTTFEHIAWPFLEKHFAASRLLFVPLASFDPTLDAAIYTLDKVAEADFSSATAENSRVLDFLTTESQPFRIEGGQCDLVCELSDKIRLMKPKTEAPLVSGEWEALGMWFETAMLPDEDDALHPGHIVTGTFLATGAAVGSTTGQRGVAGWRGSALGDLPTAGRPFNRTQAIRRRRKGCAHEHSTLSMGR